MNVNEFIEEKERKQHAKLFFFTYIYSMSCNKNGRHNSIIHGGGGAFTKTELL